MTTKYTDEEIIEYLRTLREGDVLTAVESLRGFTEGQTYNVRRDSEGDLYVSRVGQESFIRIDDDYDHSFAKCLQLGIFEIPTQAKPFKLEVTQVIGSGGYSGGRMEESRYRVNVTTDEAGLSKLRELEAESLKASELLQLYAERAEIQRKIDEMEAVE